MRTVILVPVVSLAIAAAVLMAAADPAAQDSQAVEAELGLDRPARRAADTTDTSPPSPAPAVPEVSPSRGQRRSGCDNRNTAEFFETATVEQVAACLAAGTDVAARGEHDRTPLHFRAGFNENPENLVRLHLRSTSGIACTERNDRCHLHR